MAAETHDQRFRRPGLGPGDEVGFAECRAAVGRVAGKAFAYFLFFSTLALIIGLIVANVVQPGAGMNVDPATLDVSAVADYATKANPFLVSAQTAGRYQQTVDSFGELLPKHVEVQVWRAFLESAAAEHGARMTAMDAASKNATEMIDKLTLYMNKVRQAAITKEIIEVVSGAGAPS